MSSEKNNLMDSIALFTDVSLNPKLKLGVGAYLKAFISPPLF
jgi:hypothetical protein